MSILDFSAEVYPWQYDVWQHLRGRYPKLGHALLFYGKKGCGKEAFTKYFIAWLLCTAKQGNEACHQCQSCNWLKTDIHPHLMEINNEEKESLDTKKTEKTTKTSQKIKIEQIRDILPFVHQTLEGWRVIIIDDAETMNIAASNALLKTLEEPTERVIIILLAEHYLKLPATIRSRTQHFALDRIDGLQSFNYVQQELKRQKQEYSEQKIQLLLNLTENMPLYALELANEIWLEYRQEFVQDWLALLKHKDKPIYLATKWLKILNFNEFNSLYEMLISDIIRLKLGQMLINIDLQNLQHLAEQLSVEKLFMMYQNIQQNKKSLEQNVQGQLIVENYFMQMMNIG